MNIELEYLKNSKYWSKFNNENSCLYVVAPILIAEIIKDFTEAKNNGVLDNVSKSLPKGVNIKVAETSGGIEFSQYEYDEWQKSDIDNLDDFLEQELC